MLQKYPTWDDAERVGQLTYADLVEWFGEPESCLNGLLQKYPTWDDAERAGQLSRSDLVDWFGEIPRL